MAVDALAVSGYRSIRSLQMPLAGVTVIVGPNGCGKTNLYRSLVLLAEAARGRFARTIADEGGMPSVLWAGDRKKGVVRMTLGVTVAPLHYELACGLPASMMHVSRTEGSQFMLDPLVKEERLWTMEGRREVVLAQRENASAWLRDDEGKRVAYPVALRGAESMLSQLQDPHRYATLSALREELLGWRFYHQFRTDPDAPMRHPQIGIQTPVLSDDGRDLAAALQTIREIGDLEALESAIAEAFPGCTLQIEAVEARFRVLMTMPGLHRPLGPQELSDGTLRYLCLVAALLSPRAPPLLGLNEPETSLHPDLIEPLAERIVAASRRSQLWITTHSEALAEAIEKKTGAAPVRLEKVLGATQLGGP